MNPGVYSASFVPALEATEEYDDASPPAPASIGRFEILGQLGHGGMGIVLRARDPELGRDLAIKLLRPDLSSSALEREAQAMAKLSHPNVVTIYEVGRLDGRPYIAMELVVGETLRGWMTTSRRHAWQKVIATFVAAGRGLAAAHAAGLVHRDFKPENVLLGRDGRPRVGDFGLVSNNVEAVSEPTTRTTAGATGTPAYMAPEQWRATAVDARADQFAFAVSLWEALWGARPFPGETSESLRRAVTGEHEPVLASRARVPSRIEQALRRALAKSPDDRWPDLASLLDELERAARRSSTWTIAAATGGGVAAVVVASFLLLRSSPEECPVSDRADEVWSDAVRARLEANASTIDPALGRARVAAIASKLDRDVAAWRVAGVDACRANRIDRRDSDSLYDARVRCLDTWLEELRATVALLERATDLASIDRAVAATQGLPAVDRCADTTSLSRAPLLVPQHRAEASAITTEVARAYVARIGGQRADLVDNTAKLVVRARAIDHAPTLASALREHAESLIAVEDYAASRTVLKETAEVAARAGDDELTAIAWLTTIRVLQHLRRPDEALAIVDVARAAVVRAGNDLPYRVALASYEASLIGGRGQAPRAIELLEAARKLLVEAGADKPGSEHAHLLSTILMTTGNAYGSARRYDDSIAMFRQAIALRESLVGKDHPDLVDAHMNIAESYKRSSRPAQALEAATEAARIAEARIGKSIALARTWSKIGGFHALLDKPADGLVWFDKAIALVKQLDPDNAAVLESMLGDRGFALRSLERFDDAIASYSEAIALVERRGLKTINPSGHWFNRAGTRKEKRDFEGALVDYRRAIEIALAQPAGVHFYAVQPLLGEGECLVHLKRPGEAIAPLERALAMDAPPGQSRFKPIGRFFLARALAESGRDMPRAIREARAARAELVASRLNPDWIPAIDEFLKHRKQAP